MNRINRYFFFVFTLVVVSLSVFGQSRPAATTYIRGVVRDSLTNEPLPFVAIFLKGSDKGALSKEDGTFAIATKANFISVNFNTMGYEEKN